MTPTLVIDARDVLGESPLWLADAGRLCWIDASTPRLHQLDPITGDHEVVALPLAAPVGMIAAAGGGALLAAHAGGLTRLGGPDTAPIRHPEAGRDAVAYNDGKVDRAGRLWLGSLDRDEAEPRGALWRLDAAGAVLADAGFAVANGPAFSPDGATLYLSDSIARRILAYAVHDTPPYLRGRRVLATFAEEDGLPDGLTVDAGGTLWAAMWGGGRIVRLAPDGRRLGAIPLPVSQPTSVAFGGARLDTLFVTSARLGLDADALAREPLAGGLFAIVPGVTGLPERAAEIG